MKLLSLYFLLLVFSGSLIAQENIFDASRNGNLSAISNLLSENLKLVNSKNENGHTPLILACYRNQADAAALLLKKGANVNYLSEDGAAIHAAAYKGSLEILKLLVENGAEIDAKDKNGTTALLFATTAGHNDCAILLYENGADKNIKDYRNQSAKDIAAISKNETLIKAFQK